MQMKNYFLLSILALVLVLGALGSCSKSNDASPYFVRFRLNGQELTMKRIVASVAKTDDGTNKTALQVAANSSDLSQAFGLYLDMDGTTLNTGTYSQATAMDNQVIMTYTSGIGTLNQKVYVLDNDNATYSITISSVTDNEVQGSFQASLLVEAESGEVAGIMDGQFRVRR